VKAVAIPFPLNTVEADTGEIAARTFEFARFAIPRGVLTKGHIEYVAKVMKRVKENVTKSKGYKVTHWPRILGHLREVRARPVTGANLPSAMRRRHERSGSSTLPADERTSG